MKKIVLCFLFSFLALFITIKIFAQDTTIVYKNLAQALQNPQHVYKLELKRLKNNQFPYEVFQLTNLQSLTITKSRLTSIPEQINQLKNLRYLNLSKNNLKKLPATIGDLKNLEQLIVNQNQLETLPETIGNLNKLYFLDLWSNELNDLPESLSLCENLKIIDMRGILIPDNKQIEIQKKIPQAKIYFTPGCNCGK